MLIISGTIKIRLSERGALVEVADRMMSASRHEHGCIAYNITSDLADPAMFQIFEQWHDQAALENHLHSPLMTTFLEAISGWMTEINIQKYEVIAVSPS